MLVSQWVNILLFQAEIRCLQLHKTTLEKVTEVVYKTETSSYSDGDFILKGQ